jgi:hypothetical protein
MKQVALVTALAVCATLILPRLATAQTAPLFTSPGEVQVPTTGDVPGTIPGNMMKNVSAADPFGNIDIAAAGMTPETVKAWSKRRSVSEKSELSRRCSIINNPNYTSHYPIQAQLFCRNYITSTQPARRVIRRCPEGPGFC